MKRLILQVNVKLDDFKGFSRFKPIEEIYRMSEQQARLFAKKWEVDYHQVTDCDYLPTKGPWFQRFKMYEMMDYDEILYLDMDAIILPDCPNVFDTLSGHTLSAVRSSPWDEKRKKTGDSYDELRAFHNEVLGAKDDFRPFCSGVMLVTKDFLTQTKDIWRDYLDSFEKKSNGRPCLDEAVFNKLVIEAFDGKYNELNEDWGPWYRGGKYIEHVGGPFKNFFNVEKFKEKNFPEDIPDPFAQFAATKVEV